MRINSFEAEKYREHSIQTAQELARFLEKWDKNSGNENCKQLKVQLARFLKKHRTKPKK